MSATVLTHDIKTTHASAVEVSFTGQPFGLSTLHDPAYQIGMPSDVAIGPGAVVLGSNRHDYLEDVIELELEHVTTTQRDLFVTILGHALEGHEVVYSPLGSASYGTDEFVITTTGNDWTQVGWYRWAGKVRLERKGDAY